MQWKPMRQIKSIIFRIKRIINFIPIIWKGFDWDSKYAIDLFKYQLQRTADMFEGKGEPTYGYGVTLKAQKIRTAIRLMDKVYNEEYEFEWAEKIEKIYGKEIIRMIPSETCDGCFTMEIKNEYATDDEHQKEIDRIKANMIRESANKQKRAHKLLWDFIEHNIQSWWD
jgi:hypothetical protein